MDKWIRDTLWSAPEDVIHAALPCNPQTMSLQQIQVALNDDVEAKTLFKVQTIHMATHTDSVSKSLLFIKFMHAIKDRTEQTDWQWRTLPVYEIADGIHSLSANIWVEE